MNKILFLTHYTDMYGANQSLFTILIQLKNKGYCPVLLTSRYGDIIIKARENNIECYIINFQLSFGSLHSINLKKTLSTYCKNIIPTLRVCKLILKLKPSLIYSNSSVLDIGFWASKLTLRKHVWHIREFGDEDYEIKYYLGNSFFKFLLSKSKKIIFISNALANKFELENKKYIVVYNGICSEADVKDIIKPVSKNGFNLSIIGLIHPNKGHTDAIIAFASVKKEYPNSYLQIFGNGDIEFVKELKSLCYSLHIQESVKFIPFQSDIRKIYDQTDLLLMCSKSEAMGRVLIEAMQYGVPVVAKNKGAVSEIIENGFNGLLYDNSAEELYKKIVLIFSDSELRERLIHNGYEIVKKKFTVEKYIDKIESVLNELGVKSNDL